MVGVADPVLGQAIKAFIVLADGQLRPRARSLPIAAPTWRITWSPSKSSFESELPKTASGKITKKDLS